MYACTLIIPVLHMRMSCGDPSRHSYTLYFSELTRILDRPRTFLFFSFLSLFLFIFLFFEVSWCRAGIMVWGNDRLYLI